MLFVFALLTLAGYVCRVDVLEFRLHRLGIIVLHWAGGGSTAWALVTAARAAGGEELPLIGCWLAVAMAASWLWVSWWSWREGVPPQFLRAGVSAPTARHQPARPAG